MNEEDKKLLELLGLENIPEQDKQVVLEEIDKRMSQRFIANVLSSLSPEQAEALNKEVEAMPSDDPTKIIEKIVASHPEAEKVLEQTGQEILNELKAKRSEDSGSSVDSPLGSIDTKPPIEQADAEPDTSSQTPTSEPIPAETQPPQNPSTTSEPAPTATEAPEEPQPQAPSAEPISEPSPAPPTPPAEPPVSPQSQASDIYTTSTAAAPEPVVSPAEPSPPTPQTDEPLQVDFSSSPQPQIDTAANPNPYSPPAPEPGQQAAEEQPPSQPDPAGGNPFAKPDETPDASALPSAPSIPPASESPAPETTAGTPAIPQPPEPPAHEPSLDTPQPSPQAQNDAPEQTPPTPPQNPQPPVAGGISDLYQS